MNFKEFAEKYSLVLRDDQTEENSLSIHFPNKDKKNITVITTSKDLLIKIAKLSGENQLKLINGLLTEIETGNNPCFVTYGNRNVLCSKVKETDQDVIIHLS